MLASYKIKYIIMVSLKYFFPSVVFKLKAYPYGLVKGDPFFLSF
jgi:hypothetical protein